MIEKTRLPSRDLLNRFSMQTSKGWVTQVGSYQKILLGSQLMFKIRSVIPWQVLSNCHGKEYHPKLHWLQWRCSFPYEVWCNPGSLRPQKNQNAKMQALPWVRDAPWCQTVLYFLWGELPPM